MIFFMSFLILFAAVVTVTAEQPDQYLIYAIKGECKSLHFYKADFNLQKTEHILTPIVKKAVSNWYINHYKNGDVLYSSYQDLDLITRLNISSRESGQANISGSGEAVFLRPRSDDELYFYFPKENKIRVYNFTSALFQEENLVGKVDPSNKLVVVRDTEHEERIYFMECCEAKNIAKIYDLKQKKITDQSEIYKCPDKVAITPDAKNVYIINGLDLYVNCTSIYTFDEEVDGFAAGNDVIFFTNSEYGKIFKLTKDEKGVFNKTEHDVRAKLTALVV